MKITIQDLSKSFGGRDIFTNFSLEVDSGVRLCVCGPNGTGKSTLLKLLAGVEPADGGRVILPRGCRLGYVEQAILLMACCGIDLEIVPKPIVVDEAVTLAKKYCDEPAYRLINGVLDQL